MHVLHRRLLSCVVAFSFVLLCASPASAQWFGAVYLGGNYTHDADVTIDQPALNTSLVFHEVTFAAEPLVSPQYYGFRLGKLFGATGRLGVELEFIHLKVISRTGEAVRISGRHEGVAIDDIRRMDTLVQRYSMTHGLNFVLINLVTRTPLDDNGRVSFVGRIGAGPTYPHAESTVDHVSRMQYEYAGPGIHAAAGVDVRLRRRLSATIEYKLTAARPEISVPDGRGRTSSVSHHVAAGLAFGVSR